MRASPSSRRLGRCAVLALLAVCSCSAPAVKDDAPVKLGIRLVADSALNSDLAGRPSPIAIKLYQLKAPGAFEAADFFSLWRGAAATLGGDLVSTTDLNVAPGETRRLAEEMAPSTRFVGVVAAFREIERSSWRAIAAVPDEGMEGSALDMNVADLAVAVRFVKSD